MNKRINTTSTKHYLQNETFKNDRMDDNDSIILRGFIQEKKKMYSRNTNERYFVEILSEFFVKVIELITLHKRRIARHNLAKEKHQNIESYPLNYTKRNDQAKENRFQTLYNPAVEGDQLI